ncbi:MAG: hypothetical protein AAB509_00175 [Patescibacteria group bacterium]
MDKQVFSKIWIIVIIFILIAGGILAWWYGWIGKVPTVPPVVSPILQPTSTQPTSLEEKFISEEKAINLIKELPKVKEWLALFTGPGGTGPTTGGKPIIEVDSKTAEGYTIHVYELLSDHTATFNWYSVNLKTGEIKPMFDF